MDASRRASRGVGWIGCLAAVVLVVAGGLKARADIVYPHYFTASQEARNVELELVLQPLYLEDGAYRLPRCDVELHRKVEGGEYVRLFHGPLGQQALECPEDCPPEDHSFCCERRCRTFVDVCPAPGEYWYQITLLDRVVDDQGIDPLPYRIWVWPASGTCEAPPGTVTSTEGGGCQTGRGAAWPHVVVLLVLGIAAGLGLPRRHGQPGSDGSGTAKQ